MKTTINIFLLLLFSFSMLTAQKSYSKIDLKTSTSDKAETTLPSVKASVEVDLYTHSLDFVIERPIEMEDWMTNQNLWAKTGKKQSIEQKRIHRKQKEKMNISKNISETKNVKEKTSM